MRRTLIIVLLITGLSVILAGLAGFDLYRFARQKNAQPATLILITPGSSLRKIAGELKEHNLINSRRRFIMLNRILHSSARLQAGEYQIAAASTPLEIIAALQEGRVYQRQVTIPEGFTLTQIGARLEALGLCRSEEFKSLTTSPQALKNWQIAGETLEGYLFPSTYNYSRQTSCREILDIMIATSLQQRQSLTAAAPASSLTELQILTMASLIQKEAGNNEEMPLISSVFHNRLRKHMRLASDPTTIYALGENFDGNLRRRDLNHPSPYNTYRHYGLPPGPICSPGTAAFEAALKPVPTDYLYFVSRNDGRHQFSRTLKEHNQAVRKYQLKR
ncbi:MAG: endolytic transglycosylase MltG [Deltaproteobacteria bacterium]|nr:endolytic transglycosylase MltG [Deltaproteobacteria bacterium]